MIIYGASKTVFLQKCTSICAEASRRDEFVK